MIVGIIRRKPVLTYASIVCDMLASVNSVNYMILSTVRLSSYKSQVRIGKDAVGTYVSRNINLLQ